MREAWKRETYVRSQSFSSESAVKYLHVGRRKIQISPPPGEQDQLNALPQGQQRQSNPHPMPCPPAGFTLIGALIHRPTDQFCLSQVAITMGIFSVEYPSLFGLCVTQLPALSGLLNPLIYAITWPSYRRAYIRALQWTGTKCCYRKLKRSSRARSHNLICKYHGEQGW